MEHAERAENMKNETQHQQAHYQWKKAKKNGM